ncbi:MAPK regulated corepressor interacting protein 2 isoform X1 [Rissa tridactyla]|uniref:MAPK regulated corepressor interacting protein 2 isoform X1 n=1 Tax=Rissa tridactyla TaxID=75485 RepID=UPI0023BA9228|nr:MAPK regulated corepressor interacting protein 2 isoform X1 [Rissa tridactyla]
MYTLTRGPSKLATQRRTGPTQQAVESSKLGELRGRLQPGAWPPASPAQKLVFNRVNGKRPQVLPQQVSAPEECYTLAHEENVRFVYEAWQQVEQQLDSSRSGESICGPVQYVEKTPNPGLKMLEASEAHEDLLQGDLAHRVVLQAELLFGFLQGPEDLQGRPRP